MTQLSPFINSPRWDLPVLAVSALLATSGAGCKEEYLLRGDHITAARTLTAQGTPPDRIAVLAEAPNHETRYLRYQLLNLAARVPPSATVPVWAPDSFGHRQAGNILFGIGLAHLLGLAAHITYEAISLERCRADPSCIGEDFSLLFTGPILGVTGFALLIPGIALMAKGYGAPSDVKPGRPDFTYVGNPAPKPPGEESLPRP